MPAEERIAAPHRPTGVPVDATAAAALAATDPVAFTELVRTYDQRLRALAFRLLGDRDRMDDVLQEAYVKAFRALPGFHGGSDLGTWLYRIVYNVCLDEFRRDRRRRVNESTPLTDDMAAAAVAGGEDRVSERSSLAVAFDALAEDQKAVVWLVDVEGFDYATAAQVLGIAPGTVGSRLSRAHATLRRALGDER